MDNKCSILNKGALPHREFTPWPNVRGKGQRHVEYIKLKAIFVHFESNLALSEIFALRQANADHGLMYHREVRASCGDEKI